MQELSRLKLTAKLENLPRLLDMVRDSATRQGFDSKMLMKIELATEEALVNIINHSYPSSPGKIELITSMKNRSLMIQIEDEGIPFDTAAHEEPENTGGITERRLGGIGIMLMKKLVKNLEYQRKGKKNVLKLTV